MKIISKTKESAANFFSFFCILTILFFTQFTGVLFGTPSVYADSVTKITGININRSIGVVNIYTIGNPNYKGYLFKNGPKNYFILVIGNSILYGKGKSIANPYGNIYSVSYAQFSTTPKYSTHIVVSESSLKRLNVSLVNLEGDKYKIVVNLSGKIGAESASPAKKQQNRLNFNVFIDAGHGGNDPGGIGPMGLPEDFVNLSIAKKLKKNLESKGFKVEMDRTSNQYVSLQQRASLANDSGANLFIGLYCNAAVVPYLYGTTGYYFHRNSFQFATFLNDYVSKHLNLKNDGVLRDDLYVLRFTTMPAVIIEYAYISNPYEEHLLASGTFRQLIANALANAIYKYFIIDKR